MAESTCTRVYVVDDDQEFADSLTSLLVTNGFDAQSFPFGEAFLDPIATLLPGAIMLDIKMPGMDGLAVLDELKARRVNWPVVMMTGHGEIPLAVRCIQRGAIEFIEKPFEEAKLLEVLSEAFHVLKVRISTREAARARHERLNSLSNREREVLALLTTGLTNKQIALELELSIRTVEMHRANLIRRLGVRTTPEAIRIALERHDPIAVN
jgi:two-component system response regulator FixJ